MEVISEVEKNKGRKKMQDRGNWKKTKLKNSRYRAKGFPILPEDCKTHKEGSTFKCTQLTLQDIRRMHQGFYANKEKSSQDMFILKHTSAETPKRNRQVKPGSSRKTVSIQYFAPHLKNGRIASVHICKKAFLAILNVSRFRVERIAKMHMTKGVIPKENRGGDTRSKTYLEKRIAVKNFIETFKPIDSHYCRSKTSRQYLTSDLNIRKMWKTFNSGDLRVKYEYFRKIFVSEYNISFGMPSTDVCSKCAELRETIKRTHQQPKKNDLMTEFRLHRLRYRAFYDSLRKSEKGILKLSFDCQKNMILPKVPDQVAYYSRQIYLFNFTICQGHSKEKQNLDNVFIYTWLENEFYKSSNEISSCVHHRLSNIDLTPFHSIKLYSDGCGGQNKNSTMVGMLSSWLKSEAPRNIKEIHLIFPIPGHSYIPPDRVFGRIEKQVRKLDTIIDPECYIEIFKKHGTVFNLKNDVIIRNWKECVSQNIKPPAQWHFKFAPSKRLSFKKTTKGGILVKGEVNYRCDLSVFKSLSRKGKCNSIMSPEIINIGVPVKQEKLKDCGYLLKKHFGEEWTDLPELKFYRDLITSSIENHATEEVNVSCCSDASYEHNPEPPYSV